MKRKYIIILCSLIFCRFTYAEWIYYEDTDPFDDTVTSIVAGTSSDLKNIDRSPLVVIFGCADDKFMLVFKHSYMRGDSDDEVAVKIRVDKNENYSGYFELHPGSKDSGMQVTRELRNIIEQMKAGKKGLFRVTDPADGEELTQSISLDGFSSAISKLPCY